MAMWNFKKLTNERHSLVDLQKLSHMNLINYIKWVDMGLYFNSICRFDYANQHSERLYPYSTICTAFLNITRSDGQLYNCHVITHTQNKAPRLNTPGLDLADDFVVHDILYFK